MNKFILKSALLIAITIAALTSCKTVQIANNTVQVAKFTSVEKLYDLKLNWKLADVISYLGSKPYNILSNQVDGYTIYTYKYKLIERNVDPSLINKHGGETIGDEVYNGNEQTVFLFFKQDKLEAFITSDGRKDSSPMIMLNNTLYTISKDHDKYIIVPASFDEPKSDDSGSGPFKKKKKE